jgi:hypothetical protein
VVLTNPDLKELSASVEIGNTPVIISDDVKFVSKAKWQAERTNANQMLEAWRQDLVSADPERLRRHYSRSFKAPRAQDLNGWLQKVHQSLVGAGKLDVELQDVSLFRYPDEKELIVATFTQEATIGKSRHAVRKRQYWAKEGSQWKIVSETNL